MQGAALAGMTPTRARKRYTQGDLTRLKLRYLAELAAAAHNGNTARQQ